MTEFSNVFIYTRWWIAWFGGKGRAVDVANSVLLLVTWWITRIWVFPSLYFQLAASRNMYVRRCARAPAWFACVCSDVGTAIRKVTIQSRSITINHGVPYLFLILF